MTEDPGAGLGPEAEAGEPAEVATAPPAPEELTVVAERRSLSRQRPLAAIVVLSAVLVLVGLTAGPWARTSVATGTDDESSLHIDLDPTGGVHVSDEPADLVGDYEDAANARQRVILDEAVHGSSADLARVLAVLFAVIASVALLRDLTPHSWVLVAAMAIGCLVTVMMLRDDVISALATTTSTMDLGGVARTRPTFWGALAVGASAAASLASAFAAAPRPVRAPAPTVMTPAEAAEAAAAQEVGRRSRRRFGWKSRAPHNTF